MMRRRPRPRFAHDCSACTFVGQTLKYDLYTCPQGRFPTIVARYGHVPHEYASGDGVVFIDSPQGRIQLRFERPGQ